MEVDLELDVEKRYKYEHFYFYIWLCCCVWCFSLLMVSINKCVAVCGVLLYKMCSSSDDVTWRIHCGFHCHECRHTQRRLRRKTGESKTKQNVSSIHKYLTKQSHVPYTFSPFNTVYKRNCIIY